jgi:hypothetical protein
MNNEESGARVVAYQAAFKAFREAEQAAKQLVDVARQQAASLEKWQTVALTPYIGVPGVPGHGTGFEPSRWPLPDTLNKAFDAYRSAASTLKHVWNQLKDAEKTGFQAPPVP